MLGTDRAWGYPEIVRIQGRPGLLGPAMYRPITWIVFICGGAVLTVAAFVAIGIVEVHDMQYRKIGAAQSVVIVRVPESAPPLRVAVLGPRPASALARTVDGLDRFPTGDFACPQLPVGYRLRFVTTAGDRLTIAVFSCAEVDVRSGGRWWGLNKWDDGGALRRLIRTDVAAAAR